MAAGFKLPTKNVLLSIGPNAQKVEFQQVASMLRDIGFQLYATKGTHEALRRDDGPNDSIFVYKPLVKREPNAVTLLREGKIDLVINVPDSMDSQALTDGFEMRRTAIDSAVPLVTDIKTAMLTVMSLHRKWTRERADKAFFSYASWQECTEQRDITA